jgi:carbon storage regulator
VLVLTRRAGESIVIGDEVRVVVLDVRGDTVRLGIEAPRSVQVHRAEVYAEVQAANAAAAGRTSADLESVAGRLSRIARPKPRPPVPGARPAQPPAQPPVPAPPAAPSVPTQPGPAPSARPVPAPSGPAPDAAEGEQP